jgi:hypothetical protein
MNRRGKRVAIATMFAALLMAFGVAGATLAHEEHGTELKGTVRSLTAEKLVMTATDGDVVEFLIGEDTQFLRGTTVVKREDVVIGERAIVEYHEVGETNHATEVRLAEHKT